MIIQTMNDLLEELRDKKFEVTPSRRAEKKGYDVIANGCTILRTGKEPRSGYFLVIALSQIRKHLPFLSRFNQNVLAQHVEFISRHERTETRKRTRPSCYLNVLTHSERELLVDIMVDIKHCLETKSIDPIQKVVSHNPSKDSLKSTISSEHDEIVGEVDASEKTDTIHFYPEENLSSQEEYQEGNVYKISVNRYERNKLAREKCLKHHGYTCAVCDMKFEDIYGSIGKNFIHVHHIEPVSNSSGTYTIDPTKDLVPVCPNCHSMLHKNDPPYTVAALRSMMK